MLVRQESGLGSRLLDASEKGRRQVRGEKPLAILGEGGVIPNRIIHGQAHKPAKQQIVIQLLPQQAFSCE
jgi:hypothetical protein